MMVCIPHRLFLRADWQNGVPTFTTNCSGIGYVTG